VNEVAAEVGLHASGCQYFLLAKGEGSQFDSSFNPELANQSQYFGALHKMMACVEKHADVAVAKRDSVCAKEFKQVRLAAFNEQLMY
jgi:cyclophilin family peptidyl-prolyl cis-trans isomerase